MQQTVSATNKKSYFSSTRIAFIAMFATLAGILYIFNFPIAAAFPSFLEFNFSDVPALIGTFTLGPLSGAIIVVIKVLIKLAVKGTTTVFVGELSDLLTGAVFVVVAGLIYRRHRTFKGALAAMGIGTVCMVALAIVFNRVVLVPFYVQLFFKGNWDAIVGMMTPLFPSCTKQTFYAFYLWVSVLPFNLLRCLVAIIITLPIYKRISNLINRFNDKLTPKQGESDAKVTKINVGAIIALVVVAAILVTFALLQFYGVIG